MTNFSLIKRDFILIESTVFLQEPCCCRETRDAARISIHPMNLRLLFASGPERSRPLWQRPS